jgi:hypothetical protein
MHLRYENLFLTAQLKLNDKAAVQHNSVSPPLTGPEYEYLLVVDRMAVSKLWEALKSGRLFL